LEPHPDLIYAQVVKHRHKGKVVRVTEKLIFGTEKALQEYLERSPVSHRINTSFVERQNNSLRQHNRRFTRKTLGFSKVQRIGQRKITGLKDNCTCVSATTASAFRMRG
jgi:IS1 family transposase